MSLTNALRVWLIVGAPIILQGSQMDMAAPGPAQWLALFTRHRVAFLPDLEAGTEGSTVGTGAGAPPSAVRWRITRFAPALAGLMVLLAIVPVQNLAARANSDTGDLLQELASPSR